MGLESATYISDLNASYPLGSDPIPDGDNHIRLIKTVLKATFPNITGAVTADQDTLNGGGGGTSLPSQSGNSGKFLSTNGSALSWQAVSGSGLGTVTSVALSGGSTGLTVTGSPITASGTLTLDGTLAIANGGTGQTSASAAINGLLPNQTGNSGKYLASNGTSAYWEAAPGLTTYTSSSQATCVGRAENWANGITLAKLVEFRVPVAGTLSVRVCLEENYWTGVNGAQIRIYVNGTARGALRSASALATRQCFDEDITLNVGDLLQLYGKKKEFADPSAWVEMAAFTGTTGFSLLGANNVDSVKYSPGVSP